MPGARTTAARHALAVRTKEIRQRQHEVRLARIAAGGTPDRTLSAAGRARLDAGGATPPEFGPPLGPPSTFPNLQQNSPPTRKKRKQGSSRLRS